MKNHPYEMNNSRGERQRNKMNRQQFLKQLQTLLKYVMKSQSAWQQDRQMLMCLTSRILIINSG